ncbi:leucine-rich repeat-containing protein 59 isoform X2 [Accipiter gentilis]|uniref:leucine-rich repeat-containing protein 59 isoform X2 n=1 Tax=Astur gentilis TaxID=8957 RepID=UPI0021101428|nr:leucine-rich repeat-containing protein 59 isoform X2 [Accipiter gentilis]
MSRGGGKGPSLKDKLDGNELDLSLCDLNEVPVRELAALPKATILDLSCNNLISLPSDFCSLMHLVKLDLSKNRLQQLPLDFGRLVNLQHLDLLNNRLVTLPVSFAQLKLALHHSSVEILSHLSKTSLLKLSACLPYLFHLCGNQNLKWLDLKDNPLDPVLAKVAGDCLDEKQCKQAAVKVLQHMKAIQSEQDRQRQRKLQAEREMEKKREAEQRAKEAQERELRKREKAEEKERRRREYDAQKAAKQEMEKKTKKETVQARKPASSSRPPQPPRHKHSWSRSVLRVLLFVLLCVLCTLAACKLTELQRQPLCISVNTLYEDVLAALQNHKTLQNMLQQNSQQ